MQKACFEASCYQIRIMSEIYKADSIRDITRRSFLCGAGALLAEGGRLAVSQNLPASVPDMSALKQAARLSGKTLGVFTGEHELLSEPVASAIIANTFSMIAVGNDLKFATRLRPTPSTYDFSFGDADVSWAERHNLLFRGHCLVWWNALPSWFQSYVTSANAKQVMTDHITAVVKHYAGRVYSWDVVNESVDSRLPGGLRRKPWLDFIGPEYIDIAFHTAHAADKKARLVLNECYIEHATPVEIGNRASLLALVSRLKKAGVPITTIGVQGHLRGNTALDKPGMTRFLKQVQDLGLEIMITELDVDDVDVPGRLIDETVANKYAEFLDLMMPYVNVVTLETLRNNPYLPKRPDGLAHRPNLLDTNYQPTAAYDATLASLQRHKKAMDHAS
jgi:endo-1,4-beta-xylanase